MFRAGSGTPLAFCRAKSQEKVAMFNRIVFAALAVACIVAAGAGGYIASRQNATSVAPAAAATSSQAPASAPVQETEAVVGDSAAPAPPSPTGTPSAPIAERRGSPTPRLTAEAPAPVAKSARNRGAGTSKPLPTLERTWPSSAATNQPPQTTSGSNSNSSPSADTTAQPARADERIALEAPRAPEPPQKTFEELLVASDSVIGLQAETPVSSDRARVEDRVEARVTRDVRVRDAVAIPAGAHAIGTVTQVERGGKFKERARLGIRFNTLVLADGTRLPITTDTIYRYGEAPGNGSAAKIGGGATVGAIIGAIIGGGKGAAIGATTGAGAGTAAVMSGDRSAATLRPGEPMTVRILSPVTVTIEK
jgi:hypothetical protein